MRTGGEYKVTNKQEEEEKQREEERSREERSNYGLAYNFLVTFNC